MRKECKKTSAPSWKREEEGFLQCIYPFACTQASWGILLFPRAIESAKRDIEYRKESGVVFVEVLRQPRMGSARTSNFFKRTHVYRLLDKTRNTLVYLAVSDKLIDGSPQNSISTVPVMPWGATR